MKIVKSKLSIGLISFGFISVVGAISYASLNHAPDVVRPKPKPNLKALAGELNKAIGDANRSVAKKKAPHQQEVESYLESMREFLQTPPRDGVFGGDRIPTLHGKESDNLESFKSIVNLEGKLTLRSAVVGYYSAKQIKNGEVWNDEEDHSKSKVTKDDTVRVTDVHVLGQDLTDSDKSVLEWKAATMAMQTFALSVRSNNQDTFAEPITVNGKPSWIIAKAVHASVNSCYKCHSEIKRGEPIGYTVALVSNRG